MFQIRNTNDTGLTEFPLHDFTQKEIWLVIVRLATELTARRQKLTPTEDDSRRREPTLTFSVTARVSRHARRT